MTQEDIIRMAREAGLYEDNKIFVLLPRELIHFYTLAAAAEREACAAICDGIIYHDGEEADRCAAAIRARSKT
jgi:hypothetical protein